jgi:hypothetical protein
MEMTGHDACVKSPKARDAFVQANSAENAEVRAGFRDQSRNERCRIICAYLRLLDDMRGPIAVESDLPCSKERVAEAILQELADDPEYDLRRHLEIAFVQLESFIPYREYRVIEDFKDASLRAQRIADMGDPTSILRSARIMRSSRGENAVRLEEKIYEKMRARRLQLLRVRESCCA